MTAYRRKEIGNFLNVRETRMVRKTVKRPILSTLSYKKPVHNYNQRMKHSIESN